MNELQNLVSDYDKIKFCTDLNWLCKEFKSQFARTASEIARLASLGARILDIGGKLPGFALLIKVGRGELSVHAYLELEDRPNTARVISKLPIKVQDQLVKGKPVAVAVRNEAGKIVTVKKPLHHFTDAEVKRVFVDGAILPPDMQAAVIKKETRVANKPWKYDKATKSLIVSKPCRISAVVLRKLLK